MSQSLTAPAAWQLSAADRRHFQEQGYVISPVLFDAALLAPLQAAILRRWEDAKTAAIAQGEVRAAQVRTRAFITQNHLHGPAFTTLLRHPQLLALARQMIGPDVDLFWSQAIVKPGQTGRQLGWHQDAYYGQTVPLDPGFTVLLAVTPSTIANGTVWALPGRHREGLLPHLWSAADDDYQGQYDTSAKVPLELQPGQALIFSRLLPHWSGPNTTTAVRITFQIGYVPPGVTLNGQPFGDGVAVLRGGRPCGEE